jgi:outer membrane receptor protein involved in Fe transport
LGRLIPLTHKAPRVALIYKPLDATTLHAGFACYFTPPYQAQAAQPDIAPFTNTTNQPEVPLNDPVNPERSSNYDVGLDQKVLPGLTMGLDAYYKNTRDQIDDGQFGAATPGNAFVLNHLPQSLSKQMRRTQKRPAHDSSVNFARRACFRFACQDGIDFAPLKSQPKHEQHRLVPHLAQLRR